MEKSTLTLFDNDEENIEIPSLDTGTVDQSSLISSGVEEAITGDKVKILLLPETSQLELPNYVLDFSKVDYVNVFQKTALDSLISKNGDTAIYLFKTGNLVRVGAGVGYKLSTILNLYKQNVLDKEVRIYKDVEADKPIVEIGGKDITKLRMHL